MRDPAFGRHNLFRFNHLHPVCAPGAQWAMDTTTPIRYRKSAQLRAEVDRLVARRSELRRTYEEVRESGDRQLMAHIVRDGVACNANIKRIRDELARRQAYRPAQTPPYNAELPYRASIMDTTWDDLHLAVGTWS